MGLSFPFHLVIPSSLRPYCTHEEEDPLQKQFSVIEEEGAPYLV
jgi:hypothetical protein